MVYDSTLSSIAVSNHVVAYVQRIPALSVKMNTKKLRSKARQIFDMDYEEWSNITRNKTITKQLRQKKLYRTQDNQFGGFKT